ncbi:MAG TPA: hypothetical protein VJ732_20125, partial [Bryobacteraceae bacterium]|nr:hypothetical protein [Bryobacteraceae bacterium]
MSTALPRRLWRPSSPARAEGAALSGCRGRALTRLAAHFLARLVRAGDDTASAEFELGVGGLLGLLAAPGAFFSLFLLDKYFNASFFDWLLQRRHEDVYVLSVPDKYLCICLAMAAAGIVTVLKWDRIVPDAQDYLNLAALPVRRRDVLMANAAAIAIAVLILSVDVNGVPAVLFPLFAATAAQVSLGAFLQFAAVHAACMVLASVFSFCAVFALLGTLASALPREVFRAVSAWVRGLVLVGFLVLAGTAYAGPAAIVSAAGERVIAYLPSFWFLGLYQEWQHRSTPLLARAAGMAFPGIAAALLLMAVSYAISYRRRFADVLNAAPRPARQPLRQIFLRFLDLFSPPGRGFPKACHQFVVRALLRSEAHRLSLAVSIALGWLLALQMSAEGSAQALRALFAPAYLLAVGLRVAFEIPAAAPAHWIFRAILDPRENETRGAARQVMLGFLAAFVFTPCFAMAAWRWGWGAAAIETACVFCFSLGFIEILLAGYRKIPLTCMLPGFRNHFPALCLIYVLGFELFTRLGGGVAAAILAEPLWLPLLPAALLAAWWWNRK